jgi:hypothetical protein
MSFRAFSRRLRIAGTVYVFYTEDMFLQERL